MNAEPLTISSAASDATGPQGPAGPMGPPGAQGPVGPAGPGAFPVLEGAEDPMRLLEISGAGNPAVNGLYRPYGMHASRIAYSKDGLPSLPKVWYEFGVWGIWNNDIEPDYYSDVDAEHPGDVATWLLGPGGTDPPPLSSGFGTDVSPDGLGQIYLAEDVFIGTTKVWMSVNLVPPVWELIDNPEATIGGGGSADSGKVMQFLPGGGIQASASSGYAMSARSWEDNPGVGALYGEASGAGMGITASSTSGYGANFASASGIGMRVIAAGGGAIPIALFQDTWNYTKRFSVIRTTDLKWEFLTNNRVLQLRPPAAPTANRNWDLPDASGTVALTTSQTFTTTTLAGATTATGQVELTSQLATNGTSAMTKSLVDAFNHSDDEVVRHMLYTPKVVFATFNYYTVSTTVTVAQGDSRLALTTSAIVNAGGGRQVFFSNCSGSVQYPQNFILCVTLIGHITADNDWMHVGNFSLTDAALYSVTSPHYIGTSATEGRFMVQMRKKVGANLLEARVVWKTTAGVYNEGAWVDIGTNNYNESPKFLILRATGGTNRTINAYVFHGTASGADKPNTYKLSDATLVGTVAGITGAYAGYPHALSCGFVTPSGVAQTIAFSNLLTSQ